jgi:hypothetical protein
LYATGVWVLTWETKVLSIVVVNFGWNSKAGNFCLAMEGKLFLTFRKTLQTGSEFVFLPLVVFF